MFNIFSVSEVVARLDEKAAEMDVRAIFREAGEALRQAGVPVISAYKDPYYCTGVVTGYAFPLHDWDNGEFLILVNGENLYTVGTKGDLLDMVFPFVERHCDSIRAVFPNKRALQDSVEKELVEVVQKEAIEVRSNLG